MLSLHLARILNADLSVKLKGWCKLSMHVRPNHPSKHSILVHLAVWYTQIYDSKYHLFPPLMWIKNRWFANCQSHIWINKQVITSWPQGLETLNSGRFLKSWSLAGFLLIVLVVNQYLARFSNPAHNGLTIKLLKWLDPVRKSTLLFYSNALLIWVVKHYHKLWNSGRVFNIFIFPRFIREDEWLCSCNCSDYVLGLLKAAQVTWYRIGMPHYLHYLIY